MLEAELYGTSAHVEIVITSLQIENQTYIDDQCSLVSGAGTSFKALNLIKYTEFDVSQSFVTSLATSIAQDLAPACVLGDFFNVDATVDASTTSGSPTTNMPPAATPRSTSGITSATTLVGQSVNNNNGNSGDINNNNGNGDQIGGSQISNQYSNGNNGDGSPETVPPSPTASPSVSASLQSSTTISEPSQDLSVGAKIGIGITVPVCFTVLIMLGLYLWKRTRDRSAVSAKRYELPSGMTDSRRQELDGDGWGSQRFWNELAAERRRVEMKG